MANTTGLKIQGLEEVLAKLDSLPLEIQKKLERGGLKKAVQPIKDSASQKVRVRTGELRSSLVIRTRTKKGLLTASLHADGKVAPHAHLIEYGHAVVRVRNGRARVVGRAPAYPFMRPALLENRTKVREVFRDEVLLAMKKLSVKGKI